MTVPTPCTIAALFPVTDCINTQGGSQEQSSSIDHFTYPTAGRLCAPAFFSSPQSMALCVDRCPLTNHSGQMCDCLPVTQRWRNKLVFSSSGLHVIHSRRRRRKGLYSTKIASFSQIPVLFGHKINGVSIVFPRHAAFRALGTIEPCIEEVTGVSI